MKRFFVAIVMLTFAVTLSAQSISRKGFYMDGDKAVNDNPKNSVTVCITVERLVFTPGEFARYAQKMLGVRASLAERTQTKLLSATICTEEPQTEPVNSVTGGAEPSVLPVYRVDNRPMSVEQQAQAAADMIFAMRKVRKELITGDAGENVFGAGLKSALEEIAASEQQCLDMFYGTTTTTVNEYRYTITPTADEQNYIVCRYRDGEGVLPLSDLSGDPLILTVTPEQISVEGLPVATPKDKVKQEFWLAPSCALTLLLGTETLDEGSATIYQYGKSVTLSVQ